MADHETNITLPAGTSVTSCFLYRDGERASCPDPNKLKNPYKGVIVYDRSSDSATFYRPTVDDCIGDSSVRTCQLELQLTSNTLDSLASKDRQLSDFLKTKRGDYLSPPVSTSNPAGDTSHTRGDKGISTISGPPGAIELILNSLPVAGGIGVLILLMFLIITRGPRLLPPNSTKSARPRTRSNLSIPNRSSYTTTSTYGMTESSAFTAEISRQLKPLTTQLSSLSSRLSQLETDVFAITQQIQGQDMKQSLRQNTLLGINTSAAPNQQEAPPPPPKPLSLELIKEALLTNNYSLISSYPHHFVSETAESRQGLEDVKRFAIEGDQSQASGRTQSEFIVIPLFNEHYLIPNILPNAADPARTIKRHADKNSIYRNGQGSNLLNLESLAVVQRNGDRYELANAGQVA